MAWLSGLADKAENLLNKIDKNTAAVLNKDKYDTVQSQLTEVTWVPNQSRLNDTAVANSDHQESPKYFPSVRSTPNLRSLTPTSREVSKEEELYTYLNMPNASPRKNRTDSLISPSTPSSLLVEHPTDNTDSISDFSLRSGQSSPCFTHTSIDILDTDEQDHGQCLKSETIYLSNDAEPLNNNILNGHVIGNIIENGQISIENQSEALQQECELQFRKNGMAVNKLVDLSDTHLRQYLRNVERDLQERNELLGKQETDHQKEIMILNGKLQSLETEKAQLSKQIIDLQFALERNRLELNSTRSELDQHKARALKTLQEKEKLITELRSNASTATDDATIMELNQLRQERDTLRDENQQKCEQLRIIRDELANADLKLEKVRQKSTDASIQAQEMLATERRRRLDAEEDVKLHSEEIRSLKDELLRERNSFALQIQKVESEVSRLRLQLSATATPSSEVESRLASLTQTLVLKQQALEDLTTERNALRLQLEKIEHEFRNVLGNSRRNLSYNNMNDTDDAKAQVPTFLIETPFDTGVTRRVKRAYSSLDAISVRTGVFLRRYPLARILVLIYMALLQFWVLVVLFSQSPEAH